MIDKKITGSFTYDVTTKHLCFDFDESEFISKKLPNFKVIVDDEGKECQMSRDGEQVPEIRALHLSFKPDGQNKGALMMVNASTHPDDYARSPQ